MKNAFISYNYKNRNALKPLHEKLVQFLTSIEVRPYAFVFDFQQDVDSKTMMEEAFAKIDEADFVIAELSYLSVGVGIEMGYAFAHGKKIVYLHKKEVEHSNTPLGVADLHIAYNDPDDLIHQLTTNHHFFS